MLRRSKELAVNMFNEKIIETMERWKGKTIWFLSKVYCNNCHQDSRFHQRCSIYSPAVGYHAHRVGLSKNEMYNYIQYLKLPFEWDADFQNHSKPSNAFSYLNQNKYHFQRTLYEFHPSGRAEHHSTDIDAASPKKDFHFQPLPVLGLSHQIDPMDKPTRRSCFPTRE